MKEERKYTKLPDGRIYRWVRVAPGPKGRKSVKGWSPEEVEEKIAELLLATAESEAPSLNRFDYYAPGTFGNFTFNVYCPRTYADAEQTTIDLYDGYLRHHVLPVLGDIPIHTIGYEDMIRLEASLVNHRYKNPDGSAKPLSKKTSREILMRVREILNLYGLISKGTGVQVREDWRVHKVPVPPKKKKREEVGVDYSLKLLAAASGTWLEGPLFCAMFLALRRGEICGMKTSALDRKKLRIRITEQRHPKLKDGALPKGQKTRDIPVPEEVFAAIERLRDKSSIYVWAKDGKPIPPDSLSHEVPDLCERSGLARKTPHELRALAATNLLGISANPVAVMEILGHAELDTSLIYFDPRASEKRNAFRELLSGVETQTVGDTTG